MNAKKGAVVMAAVVGILGGGAVGCASSSSQPAIEKHSCKGTNSCKGMGGCKTDKNVCRGQNACKGLGGCATDKASCKSGASCGHSSCSK